MTDQPLTLRDIALKASDRFGGVRGRALGREADKAGVKIVYTTIDKLIAGTYTSTPTRATLEALAELAQVPVEDVYTAAEQPLPQASFADQLPEAADTLTPAQREAVLGLIRQFIAQNREAWELRNRIIHRTGSGKTANALLMLQAVLDRAESERSGEVVARRDELEQRLADFIEEQLGVEAGERAAAEDESSAEPGMSA